MAISGLDEASQRAFAQFVQPRWRQLKNATSIRNEAGRAKKSVQRTRKVP